MVCIYTNLPFKVANFFSQHIQIRFKLNLSEWVAKIAIWGSNKEFIFLCLHTLETPASISSFGVSLNTTI